MEGTSESSGGGGPYIVKGSISNFNSLSEKITDHQGQHPFQAQKVRRFLMHLGLLLLENRGIVENSQTVSNNGAGGATALGKGDDR